MSSTGDIADTEIAQIRQSYREVAVEVDYAGKIIYACKKHGSVFDSC